MTEDQSLAILTAIQEQSKRIEEQSKRIDEQSKKIDDFKTEVSRRFNEVHEDIRDLRDQNKEIKYDTKEIRNNFIKPIEKWEKFREIKFTLVWAMSSFFIAIFASWITLVFAK